MNICIFDTETVSISNPFCYDIGLIIYNTDTNNIELTKNWIIEQVWHNLPLFYSSYFFEKRQKYISMLKGKKIKLDKYGYIMRDISKIFNLFNVDSIYAYNSDFDIRVFNYNCDWYKTQNPIEEKPVFDIRKYAIKTLSQDLNFQKFCDKNKRITDGYHYSTTAENIYSYITQNKDFVEEHTALKDSYIELEILLYCLNKGCILNTQYNVKNLIEVPHKRTLYLTDTNNNKHTFSYHKIIISKNKEKILLK